ncbi:MAG: hypothetical protein WBN32_15110 [Woeseia sp.]
MIYRVARTVGTLLVSSLAVIPVVIVWLVAATVIAKATGVGSFGPVLSSSTNIVLFFALFVAFCSVIIFGYPLHCLLRSMGIQSAFAYGIAASHLALLPGFYFTKGLINGGILANFGTFAFYATLFATCGGVVGYVFRRMISQVEKEDENERHNAT